MAFLRNHKQEFAEFKRALEEKARKAEELRQSEAENEHLDYEAALKDLFSRPGGGRPDEAAVSAGTVGNPSLRRQKLADELADAIESEPPSQSRFAKVSRKVWEAKDSVIRIFLKDQYDGRCQICQQTFFKRE